MPHPLPPFSSVLAPAPTLSALLAAEAAHSDFTRSHTDRVGEFVEDFARVLGAAPRHAAFLREAARYHDVGKMAVDPAILNKPGKLTDAERLAMQRHTTEGARLLEGYGSGLARMARTMALNHHEDWDGGGYPRGLKAEAIPFEARLLALCDVYEALTSPEREFYTHRPAMTAREAVDLMSGAMARKFDPAILPLFVGLALRKELAARGDVTPLARANLSRLPAGRLEAVLGVEAALGRCPDRLAASGGAVRVRFDDGAWMVAHPGGAMVHFDAVGALLYVDSMPAAARPPTAAAALVVPEAAARPGLLV